MHHILLIKVADAILKLNKSSLALAISVCIVNCSAKVKKSCATLSVLIEVVVSSINISKSYSSKTAVIRIKVVDAALILEPSCLDESVGISVISLPA